VISAANGLGPYVGLRAFRTDENEIFYGRARESLETARLWRANRLTLLYGGSGVGKTSLLQAGVIPALSEARSDLYPIGRVRPAPPGIAARNPYTFGLLLSWAPDVPPAELAEETVSGYLRKRSEKHDRYGDPLPVLVAIDQAEELFSGPPQMRRFVAPFIEELALALREHPDLRLLVSLREDYLAAILPFEHFLAGRARMRSRLLPFSQAEALEAICGPLAGTGRSFDTEAAEELVADLRRVKVTDLRGEESTVTVDSIEPVQIQIVCSELWDSLPPGTTVITSAHVREHADVDRFLASFCSRALAAVASDHGIATARIRSWLEQTFITEFGTRGTTYQGIDQTAGMPNTVVWDLENRHILKAEHRLSTRWYELQHDRLIEPIRQADSREHLEAARLARAENQWETVERQVRQAIRLFADHDLRVRAEAEHLLGEAGQHQGRPGAALTHYRTAAGFFEALQDSEAVAASLAAAGRLSLARGRHSAAAADLQAAAARAPGDLEVQTDLAQALWHGGQQRVAVTILTTVLTQNPTLVTAVRARGEILADMGESEQALRDLDAVRKQQPATTQAARALALAWADRLDAARQAAADALANGADDPTVLVRVAQVRALAGDAEQASQLASSALAITSTALPPHLRELAERLLTQAA
jgi:tetratricopeptide (TPR) repeat protein